MLTGVLTDALIRTDCWLMMNVVLSVWVSGEWSSTPRTVDLIALFDAFVDAMAQIISSKESLSLRSDKFKK